MGVWTQAGYFMHPNWRIYWDWIAFHISNELYQMNPPHITETQRLEYYRYLNDYYAYLRDFIYAGQHTKYSEYEQTIAHYRTTNNPEGAKIFDKQEAYYEKITSGTTNAKKETRPTTTKIEKVYEKKEEQEPIRKVDPKIDPEQLLNAKYDPVKYPTVLELKKPNVNLIFIGHVDAGKSTLSGRLMKNLKLVDEQELKKNEQ
jgi:hypothetical protein